MAVSFQGKTSFVRLYTTAVQAAATAAVDVSVGSITLALGQAVVGVALWLQALIANALLLTRAATSSGTDLDSFFADWFFFRLGAVAAAGGATFSRATPTLPATIQVGQLISTGPGGQQYIVTQDATNVAWNSAQNAYVLATNTHSATLPISATTLGALGNVLANTINSFVSPIPGIDAVTNPQPLANGVDAETDDAFRARFQLYILGLGRGTVFAIKSAIAALQQGVISVVIENKDPDLSTDYGYLTIVVDDGSGNPPSILVQAAGAAVDAVRAAGIRFGVISPAITNVTIALTVSSVDSAKHAADQTAAQTAILSYVNSLPIGTSLVWARIYQIAFDASDNINGVSNILINGGTADITVSAKGVVKTTSVTVA